MQVDITSFFFNCKSGEQGGTCAWATSIGQNKSNNCRITTDKDGVIDFLIGMDYKSCTDKDKLDISRGSDSRELIQFSIFDKIYINEVLIEDAKFIVLFVRENSRSHQGRLLISYPPYPKYDGVPYNQHTIDKMREILGCSEQGCWFVYDISVLNQDELHFQAIVVDQNHPKTYQTSQIRSTEWKELMELDNTRSQLNYGDLEKVSLDNLLLYGPPGTGKTFTLQTEYLNKFPADKRFMTTFHQSFSYEEFVEGIKPVMSDVSSESEILYEIEKGIFYKACEKAAQLAGYASLSRMLMDSPEQRKKNMDSAIKDKRFVLLCIDEINRGNVVSIFGDLISLIEPTKRLGQNQELSVILPYSKKKFGVPANLLIVGTMNTADRSIQLLDSALRRRFQFKELLPDYDVIKNEKAKKILKAINSRVRALINKDSQLGHSYFIDIPQQTNEESTLILKALTSKIIPLLEEYFYNDHSKIRFVLAEDKNTPNPFYIKDDSASADFEKYADIANFDETMDFYELNPKIKDGLQDESIAKSFIERWD